MRDRNIQQATKRGTTGKRAIIYVRVSTDDQADRGYSLQSQLEACRRTAEGLGYSVTLEFSEDYSGATAIAERPEGRKLAGAIKRKAADAVFIYNVDRLSRDIVDLLATVRAWLQAGIEIYSCDMGRIESEFDIVLVIKGWQGSDERKKIIERVSRGRRTKAANGKVVGSGRPLYGYTYTKTAGENFKPNAYAVEENEAKIVRLIFQWYVRGDETGRRLSAFVIARRLSELGIPMPSASGVRQKHNYRRVRAANMWSLATIYNILTNESYAGTWHYGKSVGRNGKIGKRPKEEQIAVAIDPIVDRATWEAAQVQRAENHKHSRRNQKYHEYLLSGIFKCGCGSSMFGYSKENAQGKRYVYYRCSQQTNRFKHLEETCSEKIIPAAPLEKFVWNYVKSAVASSRRTEAALRRAQKEEEEQLEPKREQLALVEGQIAEDEREFENIAAELARGVTDKVREALDARAKQRENLYKERLKTRDELRASLSERTYTEERIRSALQYRHDVKTGVENATEDDKRQWLQALRVSVTIKDRKARAKCLVPAPDGEFDFNTYSDSSPVSVTPLCCHWQFAF